MAIKQFLVAGASIGLMTSPVLAAGPAAGTPVGGLEVAPASETVSGNQLEGSRWVLWGGPGVAGDRCRENPAHRRRRRGRAGQSVTGASRCPPPIPLRRRRGNPLHALRA